MGKGSELLLCLTVLEGGGSVGSQRQASPPTSPGKEDLLEKVAVSLSLKPERTLEAADRRES